MCGYPMRNSFSYGIRSLVFRPQAYIPALLMAAIALSIAYLAMGALAGFTYDALYLGEFPQGSVTEVPLLLLFSYPFELLILGTAAFASLVLYVTAAFAIARLVSDEKAGPGKVIGFAIGKVSDAVAIAVLGFALGLIFLTAGIAAILIMQISDLLVFPMLLIFLALLIIAVYAMVKLYFLPAIMAIEGIKLKEGIKRTWVWGQGRFVSILVIVTVLSIIFSAVDNIGILLADSVRDELLAIAVMGIFGPVIGTTFTNLVLARFYLNNRK